MKLKRIMHLPILLLCCAALLCPVSAHAAEMESYAVTVYDTDGSGVVMRESPDMKSRQFITIPEETLLQIDRTSGSWGHTAYNGYTGWIALIYTMVEGDYEVAQPENELEEPVYYQVEGTEGEGLELRIRPTSESSTFGPIEEGTQLMAQATDSQWVFVSYDGHFGWVSTDYLVEIEPPEVPKSNSTCTVTIYDTGHAGLALKAEPSLDAERYLYIPEGAEVEVDRITEDGWGHTAYEGYEGWIAMQYTQIAGVYVPQLPTYGKITPEYYIIEGTNGEGLRYRIRPKVASSTYGPIEEGTVVLVYAIEDNWAYAYYDGHYGWVSLRYMTKR